MNVLNMKASFGFYRFSHHSLIVVLVFVVLGVPGLLFAHAGETHGETNNDPGITTITDANDGTNSRNMETAMADQATLPEAIANIGGPFSLTNHLGQSVTEQTYSGRHMLVFFGYSNCQIMCSISLKRIADALTILQADTDAPLSKFHPLVITVDPVNDTPAILRESLATYHPALIGLTGTLSQLKPVYQAYQQKPSVLDMELNESAIVSHSSYFYLMDQEGQLETLFPPILSAESMAKLIKKYLPK